ncbi:MAG: MBL fold metallo-hydrolase [Candidatus Nezhaarchaeota archaeon]|nr:MBL fold metallo-hydrolase [Candidatus Nezhaarchaeota archaeon]
MRIMDGLYYYPETGFTSNSYIIDNEVRILVDPGHQEHIKDLIELLSEDGFTLRDVDLIIVTHAHVDHCGSVRVLQNELNVRVAMHEAEREYLVDQARYFHRLLGEELWMFTVNQWFKGERDECVSNSNLLILHTPGHTPGSISIYSPDKGYLISGDLIFQGGVGRTDLGGSGELLKKSIELVSKLDIDMLLPGHGPIVVGKNEVKRNFNFVKGFMDSVL